MAVLPAQFRLVAHCEKKLNGNLEGINALLGQSLWSGFFELSCFTASYFFDFYFDRNNCIYNFLQARKRKISKFEGSLNAGNVSLCNLAFMSPLLVYVPKKTFQQFCSAKLDLHKKKKTW